MKRAREWSTPVWVGALQKGGELFRPSSVSYPFSVKAGAFANRRERSDGSGC